MTALSIRCAQLCFQNNTLLVAVFYVRSNMLSCSMLEALVVAVS